MRKSKCILDARVGYDGDDLSKDNHNSFDPKINTFGCLDLPSISPRAYERSNFQVAKILFLIANSEPAWKTDIWKCFPFLKILSGTLSNWNLNDCKKGKFNIFTKKIKGRGDFAIFILIFDCLPDRIFKKGNHFQLSVFHGDSESAIRNRV